MYMINKINLKKSNLRIKRFLIKAFFNVFKLYKIFAYC
jgi:hypothetical protein